MKTDLCEHSIWKGTRERKFLGNWQAGRTGGLPYIGFQPPSRSRLEELHIEAEQEKQEMFIRVAFIIGDNRE